MIEKKEKRGRNIQEHINHSFICVFSNGGSISLLFYSPAPFSPLKKYLTIMIFGIAKEKGEK